MPNGDKSDGRSTVNRRRKFIVLGVLAAVGVAIVVTAVGLTMTTVTEPNTNLTDDGPCLDNACLNGGTCNGSMEVFTCDCVDGYRGATCEEDINECLSSPCQNTGTCDDKINSYECQCPVGYEGLHCEIDINECLSSPCQNNGTCDDKINSYECQCPVGYESLRCEIETNECQSNPCHIDALCVDQFNGYWCDYCWNQDICMGGVCINEPTGSFTCDCSAGGELVNVALGKTATQSSTANEDGIPEHAVDGDKSGNWLDNSCSHTTGLYYEPWWRVDLAEIHCISRVVITNRQDCCSYKIQEAVVLITNTADEVSAIQCGSKIDYATALQATIPFECDENTLGRYVTVKVTETTIALHMCEVEVFAPMI